MSDQVDLTVTESAPLALAPLTLAPPAVPDEGFPTFLADHFDEMAGYVVDRLGPGGIDEITLDHPGMDVRPGRRLYVAGSGVCRVIGDPSDPRPLPSVVLSLIRAERDARA